METRHRGEEAVGGGGKAPLRRAGGWGAAGPAQHLPPRSAAALRALGENAGLTAQREAADNLMRGRTQPEGGPHP